MWSIMIQNINLPLIGIQIKSNTNPLMAGVNIILFINNRYVTLGNLSNLPWKI
jgi:hypothetical protein